MVQEKKFRADLYFRLNVFPITIPPLRERRDDIQLLVEHFVEKFAREQGKVIDSIPDDVMTALREYKWQGNIRELQNVLERGVLLTTGTVLTPTTTESLRVEGISPVSQPAVREPIVPEPVNIKTLADAERAHILAVLRETNWLIGGPHGAAALLGLPRTTLIARMQRLGISGGTLRRRSGRSARRLVEEIGELSSHLDSDSAAGLKAMESAAG